MRINITAEPKLLPVEVATLDDLHELMGMGAEMVRESPWLAHAPYDEDVLRSSLRQLLTRRDDGLGATVFIQRDESKWPVGVLAAIEGRYHLWSQTRYAQELALWVRPEWRRRGVAGFLVVAFERWAADRCIRHVIIGAGTGLAHAATAKLYEGMGYALSHQDFTKHLEAQ